MRFDGRSKGIKHVTNDIMCINHNQMRRVYRNKNIFPNITEIHWDLQFQKQKHTVDGRNPAPPGMYKTL